MFIEGQNKKRYVIELDLALPSQYLLRVIASEMDIAKWDCRSYPDHATFNKTYKNLKDSF